MDESRSHAQRLWRSTQQARDEANALVGALEEMANEAETLVQEEVNKHPYTTVAAAAGVGFVLGGGLATRLTQMLIGIAGRVAIAVAVREVSNVLGSSDRAAVPVEETSAHYH